MRENRTYRLSGGRRRALRWAPPPTRHRRSGGIEPTRPRGGKGAPAGGTVGGKDGQHTEVRSRLHVTTTDSRTGQTSLRDGGGHRLASWTSGYATARSEAVLSRSRMRQNPHVRICGGPGSATTLVYPTAPTRGAACSWSRRSAESTGGSDASNGWRVWRPACLRRDTPDGTARGDRKNS